MPTYDYLCIDCNYSFEKMQKMSEPVSKKCPKCNKMSLKRLIGIGGGAIVRGTDHPVKPLKVSNRIIRKRSTIDQAPFVWNLERI